MPCFKTTDTWAKNLRTSTIGEEFKQYTIQLTRHIGCCAEIYQIFVNGRELEHHTLSYNPCSPLCCPGGVYEWDQDGHSFMLMYNSLSFTRAFGGYRLFIDGIDVNTGRDIKAYWRRRGMQIIFLGLCFILLGVVLSLIFRYAISTRGSPYYIGYGLVLAGVIYVIMGAIPFLRTYPQPRYGVFTDVSYSGPNSSVTNVV